MPRKLTGIGLFAAGAGVGAAIALLYAPRSGKHTRARLRNTANRTIHRVEEIQNEVRSRMSEIVEDTSETIATAITAGKDKAVRVSRECLQGTVDRVRERMNEGRERVEEYIRALAG